ncbi:MAG: UDP-N-acetylmuramate--L-alanine ligase [Bacteroidota bacterium]
MNLDKYHIVYFIGIGGIGMSALARWFNKHGFKVLGYDKTATPLTDALQAEGIPVAFDDDEALIPEEVKANKENTLVIYTPAIPKDHNGWNYLQKAGYDIFKRSQVLGMITEKLYTVAVAGTHGKTTTASMIAHILKHAGKDITAFLGGLSTNYNTNLIINEIMDADTIAVVEADEFDRSFLTLSPDIAVITSADADHLDIYGDKGELERSFRDFIRKVKVGGELFVKETIAERLVREIDITYQTYAIERGQSYAINIRVEDGCFVFDYAQRDAKIEAIKMLVPGFHNVENAVAAIAVALKLGLTEEQIRAGIESYEGVKRRFEYIVRNNKITFIDDYAHHPMEIFSFLKSVKKLYPNRKVTAVFQPHLYTRTRDFVHGFAASLSLADELFLLDIYPARELPIEGVTSEIIFDGVLNQQKVLCSKETILDKLKETDIDILVTIGAGDIDQLVKPIKALLDDKYHVE